MAARVLAGLALVWLTLSSPLVRAQQSSGVRDLMSDTWAATDALGRSLPTAATARPPRKDKFVGVFYFVWHSRSDEPFDNTKALAANPDHPQFGGVSAFHWWGEPAVGYYRADDPWVARKNLQMLGDAGVDVLFLDMTNAATYPKDVQTLFDTATQMRREGSQTPRIAFITHAGTVKTVTNLYETYYSKGLYRGLWFTWDGRPLILGDKAARDAGVTFPPDIVNFFTWRNSWAWDPGQDKWQWIDKYPQRAGWHADPNVPEEVPVAIAGHPTDNLGRSFHSDENWGKGTEPPPDKYRLAADRAKGLQFAQQWERALKIDPQFIFITGWNEWIAQRFVSGAGGGPGFLGRVLTPGETFFVDNFNEEFSRDAMPMRGGYGDNYYLQMVDGIRRFKGIRPVPRAQSFQTMSLGDFASRPLSRLMELCLCGCIRNETRDSGRRITLASSPSGVGFSRPAPHVGEERGRTTATPGATGPTSRSTGTPPPTTASLTGRSPLRRPLFGREERNEPANRFLRPADDCRGPVRRRRAADSALGAAGGHRLHDVAQERALGKHVGDAPVGQLCFGRPERDSSARHVAGRRGRGLRLGGLVQRHRLYLRPPQEAPGL